MIQSGPGAAIEGMKLLMRLFERRRGIWRCVEVLMLSRLLASLMGWRLPRRTASDLVNEEVAREHLLPLSYYQFLTRRGTLDLPSI